jgi:hypothetical protein
MEDFVSSSKRASHTVHVITDILRPEKISRFQLWYRVPAIGSVAVMLDLTMNNGISLAE